MQKTHRSERVSEYADKLIIHTRAYILPISTPFVLLPSLVKYFSSAFASMGMNQDVEMSSIFQYRYPLQSAELRLFSSSRAVDKLSCMSAVIHDHSCGIGFHEDEAA